MKGPAPNIYFVAPEANNSVTRKLKGAAMAFGVPLIIVQNPLQLPSVPEINSILILPEGMKLPLSDNHDSTWNRIFLLSTAPNYSLNGSSKILISATDVAPTVEYKVIHAVLASIGVKSNTDWYSSKLEGTCKAGELNKRVSNWLKSLKALNFDPISIILKSLENISSNLENVPSSYRIALDGHSIDISLKFENCSADLQKTIADTMACPSAHLIMMRQEKSDFSINIQCSLSTTKVRQIKLIETATLANISASESDEREAS